MNQKQIFELMEKFDESNLKVLKVESEGFKITLKSEYDTVSMPMATYPSVGAVSAASPSDPARMPAVHAAPSGSAEETASAGTEIIKSPIVGSFYRSPGPDSPAYVDEGSVVKAGDSICIIEAMKIMNKLEADFACEIVKILAENGQMVEYGAPLFEVKRK
jgi:acetyl-CoA carboxylase biotin carboxyl carrier protein